MENFYRRFKWTLIYRKRICNLDHGYFALQLRAKYLNLIKWKGKNRKLSLTQIER